MQPIQVKLRLSVPLYTFFPLVSDLADEIAAGVSLNHSQVRIMGANAANQQLDKTIILINLVPLGEKFNHTTALMIYQKFWLQKVFIESLLFGGYKVIYVQYPGKISIFLLQFRGKLQGIIYSLVIKIQ